MSDRAGGYTEYGFTAEFYDHVAPYAERGDVGFFVEMAQAAGGPVLEIGCGTGRVLIPTARAGIEIVGLDLSPSMLAVCRSNLAQESAETQARVRLVEGDMRDFDLDRQFALVTLPFRPFQHLTSVEDQIACLTTIHRHLAPGGRLVLDLFNPSIPFLADPTRLDEFGDEPEITLPDGRRVLRRCTHHGPRLLQPGAGCRTDLLRDPPGRPPGTVGAQLPDALPVPLRGRASAGALRIRG